MPKLEPLLPRLLTELERLNAPVVPLLQPGLILPEIQTRVADLPLRPPAEVYALFQWRNGVLAQEADRHLLFPDGSFFSLEVAVQEYRQQIAAAQQVAAQAQVPIDEIWRPEWLPLFGAAEGDLYVVLCGRREQPRAPIFLVDHETRSAVQIYDHLAGMIAAVAECYRRGAYTVAQGAARCQDPDQAAQIAQRHNPRSAHWLMLAAGAQSTDDLVRALQSSDAGLREKAAQALLVLRDRRAASGLIDMLGGATPAVRVLAARLLGSLGDATAASALIQRLQDEDSGVRSAAAQALGELRAQSAASALIDTLRDNDPTVRVKTIWALGALAAPQAVEPLAAILDDDSPALRLEAAKALGMIGDQRAAQALLHATQDAFPDVRQMAAWALGQLR